MPRADEAIILAGGLGTRLRSVVNDVPKPLAPVAGKPFLEWLLLGLAARGVRKAVLATGYLAEKIESTFGNHCAGLDLVYSVESEPLGTGGSIALAARHIENRGAHVVNGDTFLEYDLGALEAVVGSGDGIGIALALVDDVHRYGAVELDGERVRRFEEKGKHGSGWINAGSYFLTESLLRSLPDGSYSFENEILVPAVAQRRVFGFTHTNRFIDIGIPEDYLRAQNLFGDEN